MYLRHFFDNINTFVELRNEIEKLKKANAELQRKLEAAEDNQ